jgi:hypothetical protein
VEDHAKTLHEQKLHIISEKVLREKSERDLAL